MPLTELLSQVRDASGLLQKQEIQRVQRHLKQAYPNPFPNGDDAAVIPHGDHFDLLAGEGFMDQFVAADPWFAGWCGIMVNVSDIAAMGGTPVAVVNALWGGDDEVTDAILQGMSEASRVFQVPIVGGHTNLRSQQPHLSVSILGRCRRVLSSFAAQAGQSLIAVVDLRGEFRAPFLNWNAATEAPPQRLRGDLALFSAIAESQLASAAKDISQAGILGTCVMLMESAGVGMDIELEAIPKPAGVAWQDWLCAFPSFGYLLTAEQKNCETLLQMFHHRDIHGAVIGSLNTSGRCCVSAGNDQGLFWDLTATALTGLTANSDVSDKGASRYA
ncbi:sll0787 family AIR synthase-like protein [Ketobacter sp. MCCC 1A13808]|uniref:sll0787 family AIR synthase-like protein n=1 Tax=Ketobacter sp. MCCC 1A13808 TaxID=2602738 RepID=UPI000F2C70A7|nr:sll0787 family AIR synthase-like protein [Ketobacter sp. MCCC 1A13808]MVF11522.1 sll0787 family AIR synthase-like protein [Ketobacter sp. MCCC 1A13808]RLP53274.1 MAG: sll0787 family AIR synthase-like protein [Ketobacter sp.]